MRLFFKLVALAALLILVGVGLNVGLSLVHIRRHFWTPMEEGLNDTANLLAAMVSSQLDSDQIGDLHWLTAGIRKALDRSRHVKGRPIVQTREDLHILVTDATGRVLYDSQGKMTGELAEWRDIRMALAAD